MKRKYLLLSGLALLTLGLNGQHLKEGYIVSEKSGVKFQDALQTWNKGDKLTEDDNFFISRVKPKVHFRNAATQVNQSIDATNDKKLLFWVPINNTPFNALPDGKFDSEVFPMWNYVTHYGNWTAGFVRMPGNFADVAHKNGVSASVVAGIPFGSLNDSWSQELNSLVAIGPDKMADFMTYYGIDGLGYNSEFGGGYDIVPKLQAYHGKLVEKLKTSGKNPLFENIWYDGTSDEGYIRFDAGLGDHNDGNFGNSTEPRTSFFFNYNWNNTGLIDRSIAKAKEMGRNPLDLYVGINMQGGQPGGNSWPLLVGKNLSIGLWGAHSQNMFFESRGELGSLPEIQQRTYLKRVENYFTGGTRNPVNTPAVSSMMSYSANNPNFFGMSTFMSARSSFKWDLSVEPFISYFNLGNGKFFNWGGQRQNDKEWYNIGVQDYLPTWRWWFTDKFMGREDTDVPASGLTAEFSWDDAWMGGSMMRVYGATTEEYLHLFKTEFALRSGDVITVRYKLISGKADLSLVLSAKGDESTILVEDKLGLMDATAKVGDWVEKKFTVRGPLSALNGKEIAMVALHFKNAENLNLYVGEFSIVRGTTTSVKPATPEIERTQVLGSNYRGVDAKIIFNMPNDKGTDVCYNLDVNTSLFKLYAQQEDKDPMLMGVTTSWAGMYFGLPVDFSVDAPKVRLGVAAVSRYENRL